MSKRLIIVNLTISTNIGAAINRPIIDTYVEKLKREFGSVNSTYDLERMGKIITDHIMPQLTDADGVVMEITQKSLTSTMLLKACTEAGKRIFIARPTGALLEMPKFV
jgi:hypothetical protein